MTKSLIAITAGINGTKILIRAYFDRSATESDRERIGCVGTEVIADFPDSYDLEEQILFSANQEEMEILDFWAFLRAKVEES